MYHCQNCTGQLLAVLQDYLTNTLHAHARHMWVHTQQRITEAISLLHRRQHWSVTLFQRQRTVNGKFAGLPDRCFLLVPFPLLLGVSSSAFQSCIYGLLHTTLCYLYGTGALALVSLHYLQSALNLGIEAEHTRCNTTLYNLQYLLRPNSPDFRAEYEWEYFAEWLHTQAAPALANGCNTTDILHLTKPSLTSVCAN
jgi:hypothetical protein